MQIGIVGKPNTGKSTFFKAATLVDAEIGNRPFVTIKANQGTGYVTQKCVHREKGIDCQPMNSKCEKGTRMVPIQMLDVAGLVPDAWQGKGLGNQFMNDLMQANALVHVLDASGSTDAEGNEVAKGSYEISQDVEFLEKEVAYWILGILKRNWDKLSKSLSMSGNIADGIANQLSGLGVKEEEVKAVMRNDIFKKKPSEWSEETLLEFSSSIREKSKPMIIAANKCDVDGSAERIDKLKSAFPKYEIIPSSAESELALRKADQTGVVSYVPGSKEFEIVKELPGAQKKALDFIQEKVLDVYGSTGVQTAINKTAFDLLGLVAVYPVQDPNKWMSGKGHVLPDTFLVKKGTNPKELAGIIHTDFAKDIWVQLTAEAERKFLKVMTFRIMMSLRFC